MPNLPIASFTFGDGLLTVIEIAFFFLWIWIAVGVVFDIFRSHDLSNVAKAVWVLAIFLFPLLGVLAYLLIRGQVMHEHQVRDQLASAPAAPFPGPPRTHVQDLHTLADLHQRGLLDDDEFARAKAKALQ